MMRLLIACCCPIQTDSDCEMSDLSDEDMDQQKDVDFDLKVSYIYIITLKKK